MNDDRDFVKKAYQSIVLAWATAMLWTLAYQKLWIALSITLGALLGTGILTSCDWIVRRVFVPDGKKPSRAFIKFALIKLPLIGFLLYWLVRWDKINLLAFCGGVVLVHFAILAKLLGIRLVERLSEDKRRINVAAQTHTKES